MKLPNITQGPVQSLGRVNVSAEAEAAALPYKAIQQASQYAIQAKQKYDLVIDEENAAKEAARASASINGLKQLQNDQVGLNDLPADLVTKYKQSKSYDPQQSGFAGDNEFVQTHTIAELAYSHYGKELAIGQDNLSTKRQRELFNNLVGKDLEDAYELAQNGIEQSYLTSLRNSNDALIQQYRAENNLDGQLRLYSNGLATGVYNDADVKAGRKQAFATSKERLGQELEMLRNDQREAAFQGNEAMQKALAKEYNMRLSNARAYGDELITDVEKNEYANKMSLSQYEGELGNLVKTGLEKDNPAITIASLINEFNKPAPPGVSREQKEKAVASAMVQINRYKDAEESAIKDQTKKNQYLLNLGIAAETKNNHGYIPSSGPARKAFDDAYEQQRNSYAEQQLTPDMIFNAELQFFQAWDDIPKAKKQQWDNIATLPAQQQLDQAHLFATLQVTNPGTAKKYTGPGRKYLEDMGQEILNGNLSVTDITVVEKMQKKHFSEDFAFNIERFEIDQGSKDKANKAIAETANNYMDEFYRNTGWFGTTDEDIAVTARVNNATNRFVRDGIGYGFSGDDLKNYVQEKTEGMFGVDYTDPKYPEGKIAFYPPDKTYGFETRPQFEKMMSENHPDIVAEYGMDSLYYEADGYTDIDEGGSYRVMIRDGDLAFNPVSWNQQSPSGKSGPIRFQPNINDDPDFINAKNKNLKEIAEGEAIQKYGLSMQEQVKKELQTKYATNGNALDVSTSPGEIADLQLSQRVQLLGSDEMSQYSRNNPDIQDDARKGELGKVYTDNGIVTEYSITVYDEKLGGYVNIPTMVLGQKDVPGMIHSETVTDEQAKIALARAKERVANGSELPAYKTEKEAIAAAEKRTDKEKKVYFDDVDFWNSDYYKVRIKEGDKAIYNTSAKLEADYYFKNKIKPPRNARSLVKQFYDELEGARRAKIREENRKKFGKE